VWTCGRSCDMFVAGAGQVDSYEAKKQELTAENAQLKDSLRHLQVGPAPPRLSSPSCPPQLAAHTPGLTPGAAFPLSGAAAAAAGLLRSSCGPAPSGSSGLACMPWGRRASLCCSPSDARWWCLQGDMQRLLRFQGEASASTSAGEQANDTPLKGRMVSGAPYLPL
jgi:hypothetical protein